MSLSKELRADAKHLRTVLQRVSDTSPEDLLQSHVLCRGVGLDLRDSLQAPTTQAIRERMTSSEYAAYLVAHMAARAVWDAEGAPTFALGAGAVAAFAATSVEDVRVSEVQLPFPACLIVPDQSQTPLLLPSDSRTPAAVRYIFVARMRHPVGPYTQSQWRALRDEITLNPAASTLAAEAAHLHVSESYLIEVSLTSDVTFKLQLPLTGDPKQTVRSWFERLTLADPATWNPKPEAQPLVVPHMQHLARLCVSVVTSLCLYLDNSGTSIGKEGVKWRDKAAHYRGQDNACVYPTAGEIKLDKAVLSAARADAMQDVDRAGWKLSSSTLVRGHWKLQVHGKGRTERKRIWIAPYTKGPEASELVAKLYVK